MSSRALPPPQTSAQSARAMLQSSQMSQRPELFGTDGVRGVAGNYPLDRSTVFHLGRAVASVMAQAAPARPLRVVLGEDTRESSAWISRVLAAGLASAGADVAYAGVITTPGVAYLTRHHRFAAGVMVSASHNPYQDNGIKVLSSSGMKLPEATEVEIEKELRRFAAEGGAPSEASLRPDPSLLEDYLDFLARLAPAHGQRVHLVADCAHGAASRVLPALLNRLGMEVDILHAAPSGRNINLACGSLHPEAMAERTRAAHADLGVAFDGDADRAIFASREGRIADGDHVLFAAAPHFHARGALKGGAVVGTLMTNYALELALTGHGLALRRTPVGDRYVLEEMLRSGINLGGEPSGHLIFADVSLAGDGLITLLEVLRLIAETGHPFTELVRDFRPFPQLIRNVRVREKKPLEALPDVHAAIEACRQDLAGRGRVVVRYSGTEKLARVMVEAEEAERVEHHAASIARAIESVLGAP